MYIQLRMHLLSLYALVWVPAFLVYQSFTIIAFDFGWVNTILFSLNLHPADSL